MSEQARQERIALNESRFREINDRAKTDLARLQHPPERFELVCECGRAECREQVMMSAAEYEGVRSDAMLFVIRPGHEFPETEDVEEANDRFSVVRKHSNVRDIAEGTDPRRSEGS